MDVEHLASRSKTYALFGTLFLTGITPNTLPIIHQLDDLARSLPQPFDLTQAAAAHYHLFGMNIFANESFFWDSSGLVGGDTVDAVLDSYQRSGFMLSVDASSGDHLGVELQMLGFLCGAQANAQRDGQPAAAQRRREEQRRFLQRHLLRWLVPCAVAIRQADDGFFAELANLTLALVAGHQQHLVEPADPISLADGDPVERRLPDAPDLLGNEKTSLRDIAEFLVTPSYAGLYLSRDVIAGLGRRLQLPRGFGERKLQLTNMLQSAAQYGQTLALFRELDELTQLWHAEYEAVVAEYSVMVPFVTPWQQRTVQTRQLLTNMGHLIRRNEELTQNR